MRTTSASSAVDTIAGDLPLLGTLNIHRDLVFIEQRGTGQPDPLNCPAFPATLADLKEPLAWVLPDSSRPGGGR
jgi:hypothetical protein